MRRLVFFLFVTIALPFVNGPNAQWTGGLQVNPDNGLDKARMDESAWDMCVDDSNVIQIVYEYNSPTELQTTEIYYRAKMLRAWGWRNAKVVTEYDNTSSAPGHPSIANYRYQSGDSTFYAAIIAYISQNFGARRFKYAYFDRHDPINGWSNDFRYISPDTDSHIMPDGPTGGAKTGNIVACGIDTVFACWPYSYGGGINPYRVLYYRTMKGGVWGASIPIYGNTDTCYWGQDLCPTLLPSHDVELAYSRCDSNSTYIIFCRTFHFADSSFSQVHQVSQNDHGKAAVPYVVCWDRGNNQYTLHFVWEEQMSDTFRVMYTNYSSTGGWRPNPVVLEPTSGRRPTVAVTPDGELYVAWQDEFDSLLYYKHASPLNFTWSDRYPIQSDYYTKLRYPLMVADKVGNLHLESNGYDDTTSDIVYFFLELPPLAPRNITALNDTLHPSFAWAPCKEPNLRHYHIYRMPGKNGTWTLIASVNDTSYIDSNVRLDPDYPNSMYYQVCAEDQLSQESPSSASLVFHYSLTGGKPKLTTSLMPDEFSLSQNYPNPFNSDTKIDYTLPEVAYVSLEVYDMLGRRVKSLVNETQEPGLHHAVWKSGDNPSGMYFYRLKAREFDQVRKMLLIK